MLSFFDFILLNQPSRGSVPLCEIILWNKINNKEIGKSIEMRKTMLRFIWRFHLLTFILFISIRFTYAYLMLSRSLSIMSKLSCQEAVQFSRPLLFHLHIWNYSFILNLHTRNIVTEKKGKLLQMWRRIFLEF